jgi:hypothetical protein
LNGAFEEGIKLWANVRVVGPVCREILIGYFQMEAEDAGFWIEGPKAKA